MNNLRIMTKLRTTKPRIVGGSGDMYVHTVAVAAPVRISHWLEYSELNSSATEGKKLAHFLAPRYIL